MPRIEFRNSDDFYVWIVQTDKPFSAYFVDGRNEIVVLQTVSTRPILYGYFKTTDKNDYKELKEKIKSLNIPSFEVDKIEFASDKMGKE